MTAVAGLFSTNGFMAKSPWLNVRASRERKSACIGYSSGSSTNSIWRANFGSMDR